MTIQIKNKAVLTALLLKQYDHNLISIIEDLIDILGERDVVITEGWRTGGGVHSTLPCRGMDIRSWIYADAELEEIKMKINELWIYDPERPNMACMMVHNVGKGIHAHIQSHPRTIRKVKCWI